MPHGRTRPLTVTLAVAMTWFLALWDGALAALFLGAGIAGADEIAQDDATLLVVAGTVSALVALASVALGVFLARGSNGARLLFSLVLLFRLGYTLSVDTATTDARTDIAIAVASVTVVVVVPVKVRVTVAVVVKVAVG